MCFVDIISICWIANICVRSEDQAGNESISKSISAETKWRLRERLYQIDDRVFELKAELYDLEYERIEIMMDLWPGNEPMQKSIERSKI